MAVVQCVTAAKETGVAGAWMNLTASSGDAVKETLMLIAAPLKTGKPLPEQRERLQAPVGTGM
ncbi:hypothetical protein AM571_CH02083 [Rhizobium etli 8C-3]|uniref:Uncharacterized protein n=1 Tax=Rhizobium etli 8C-3 TaxID=538025 RepID=A0A1L5P418_RHIET|nr:hypothetical protein AM571_CH02083 [Rhizobium etli 8C-3]